MVRDDAIHNSRATSDVLVVGILLPMGARHDVRVPARPLALNCHILADLVVRLEKCVLLDFSRILGMHGLCAWLEVAVRDYEEVNESVGNLN